MLPRIPSSFSSAEKKHVNKLLLKVVRDTTPNYYVEHSFVNIKKGTDKQSGL